MEQAKHRQQQEVAENRLRRGQLKDSMRFFDMVHTTIEAIKDGERHERDWEKFMRCNGLPNAASASDLRKYIHQWHADIAKRQAEARNWLLRTDERTLLTQDSHVPDLTRATLRQQQENLGDVYAQRIKEVLGVSSWRSRAVESRTGRGAELSIKSTYSMLSSPPLVCFSLSQILNELDDSLLYTKEHAPHLAIDLTKLKTEMRVFLKQHLDEFTHKTMSHIERDME